MGSHPEGNFFGQIDGFEASQAWLAQTKAWISWYTKVTCNSFAIVSDNVALFDLSSGRRWQTGQYSLYVASRRQSNLESRCINSLMSHSNPLTLYFDTFFPPIVTYTER